MNWFILTASLRITLYALVQKTGAAVVHSERDNNATTIEIAPNRV
jgi:hypothetical protein